MHCEACLTRVQRDEQTVSALRTWNARLLFIKAPRLGRGYRMPHLEEQLAARRERHHGGRLRARAVSRRARDTARAAAARARPRRRARDGRPRRVRERAA
jgi:hypothetical protein